MKSTRGCANLALILLIGVGGLGLAGALYLAKRPPDTPKPIQPAENFPAAEITAEILKQRMSRESNLLVAFVGTPGYFQERRIPGAICVPYAGLEANFGRMDRDRPIALYCGCCAGASEGVSGSAVRRLRELGFRNVVHLRGHFAAWQSLGYPCEGTHPDVSPERAYANQSQKDQLDAFVAESARRRVELVEAMDAEKNPERKAEMNLRLAEADRESELRGLELKRRISEENGDVAKVKAIDEMIEARKK